MNSERMFNKRNKQGFVQIIDVSHYINQSNKGIAKGSQSQPLI